jgi:hypothetical protein
LSQAQYIAKKAGLNSEPFDSFNSRPEIEPKGPHFGPKIGSTLSLSAQITTKQKFLTQL